jgi:guanylate kinase
LNNKGGKKGLLVVVSGYSGAGKGALMKELVARYENYALSVSMTTRAPRPGEADGREYYFVTRERFEETIAAGGLIEYAVYADNYYGTPIEYVEREQNAGKDVILEIETQGALKVKERFPESLLLFVVPPSIAELKRRLKERGTESGEDIAKRLNWARKETDRIEQYDYIVINDDLDKCVEYLHSIIQAACATPGRNREFVAQLRADLS